ncbi:hypothetical protein NMY22_g18745 [Coprinellus aureogranulatus]|nr:hypothetical protein NMY22_g18745 [Coprinellus aureogranulatus]
MKVELHGQTRSGVIFSLFDDETSPTASQEFFTTSWDFASATQRPADGQPQDNGEEGVELHSCPPAPFCDEDLFPEIVNPQVGSPLASSPVGRNPLHHRPPKSASSIKSASTPSGKNVGSSRRRNARRQAKKLAAEVAKAIQIERLGNVALTHHFKDSAIRKHARPSAIFTVAASARAQDFPHSAGGSWVGPRDVKGRTVPWTLKELEELGYEYVPYVKGRNVFFLDASGTIIGGLVDCPSSADWASVIEEAGRSLNAARSLAIRHGAFPKGYWVHRRGSYLTLSVGVSMGGGQKRPGVLVHQLLIRRKIAQSLLKNQAIKRVAGYQSSAFAFLAPRVFCRYAEDLGRLFENDSSLKWNFANSIFPACGFNCGPQCVTVDHFDHANLSWGLCVVTPFGRFDYQKGGHLVLHGLRKVIEFPPGTSAAFPSAVLEHSNTPVQPGEERTSMTQFAAGGLFRWVSYGYQTSKSLSTTEKGRAFRDEVNGEEGRRWAEGIALFSTMDTWKLVLFCSFCCSAGFEGTLLIALCEAVFGVAASDGISQLKVQGTRRERFPSTFGLLAVHSLPHSPQHQITLAFVVASPGRQVTPTCHCHHRPAPLHSASPPCVWCTTTPPMPISLSASAQHMRTDGLNIVSRDTRSSFWQRQRLPLIDVPAGAASRSSSLTRRDVSTGSTSRSRRPSLSFPQCLSLDEATHVLPEQGQRLENLNWRLGHLQNLIGDTDNANSASSPNAWVTSSTRRRGGKHA